MPKQGRMKHEFNEPTARTLELILESLPVVAWLTDGDLKLTWVCGGAIRTLAVDCLYPVGAPVTAIAGDDHPLVSAHGAAQRGETREIEIEWMQRSYSARVAPLRNEQGAVIGCSGTAYDVTELKRAERTILWQSSFDPLTGALNRSRFLEETDLLLLQAKRDGRPLTIVLVDIDDFGPVNASLGQARGDDVLRAFARRITAGAPARAIAGRVEGDEIAIALLEPAAGEVNTFCSDIHAAFADPFVAGEQELRLSVSIGSASHPGDGLNAEQLLRAAKAAAHRAHELGGGQSQIFFPALTIESTAHLELEQSLRRAVERGEFLLMYQPQVALADGSLQGIEVLLRWRKDDEILPARSFIPHLEASPLMVPVGHWIIDRALRQLKEWREAGLNPGRLAINVGARQLNDESFVSNVRRSLCLHGIPAELLDIEITETAAMQNLERSVHILEELRGLGAEISVDDFGTGYSSLSYLKLFTITGLKIDQTFVSDLPDSRTGTAIVEAMISTAKALDLRVVAEGVETEEQAAWLRRAGCASAQGFLFARPMPPEDIAAYLVRHH